MGQDVSADPESGGQDPPQGESPDIELLGGTVLDVSSELLL